MGSVCLSSWLNLTVGRSPGSNRTLLCMWFQGPPGGKGQVKYRRVGRERAEDGSEKLDQDKQVKMEQQNQSRASAQDSSCIRLKSQTFMETPQQLWSFAESTIVHRK